MLYRNLISKIIEILAENGETRTLTLVKLTNTDTHAIKVEEPMVFEHNVSDESNIFCLPIRSLYMAIDWGDGDINNDTMHDYKDNGSYRVKVYNYSEYEIELHHKINWANDIYNFISIGRIGIKNFIHMFSYTNFNGIIGPNWDTTQIYSMAYMFNDCLKFNQKFGQNWDTRKVTNMTGMFHGAIKFNQPFGKNWDTGNLRLMDNMFGRAIEFNQPFGQKWDTRNVSSMAYMFYGATNFNQPFGFSGGKYWDTGNVRSMAYMFYNATNFNQPFGENWDVQNLTTIENIFRGANNFKQKYGQNWDTRNLRGARL